MSEASNPPRDLTDTYQRIYDEEELAEAEDSSPDNEEEEMAFHRHSQSPSRPPRNPLNTSSRSARNSKASTPEAVPAEADKENAGRDHTEALSEGSGMSFLNQLTDQNLAAKATPVISSHVKDMRRLQQGISTRPISFHAGTKPSEYLADDARSNASSTSSRSSRRRNLQLNSPIVNGVPKALSDTTLDGRPRAKASPLSERKPSSQSKSSSLPRVAREPLRPLDLDGLDARDVVEQPSDDEGDQTSPELRTRERQFELNRARKLFGIRRPTAGADTTSTPKSVPLGKQPDEVASEYDDLDDITQDSIQSRDSRYLASSTPQKSPGSKIPITNKGVLKKWRQSAIEQQSERTQQSAGSDVSTSAVDWLGVGADEAIPSIENGGREDTSQVNSPTSLKHRISADRLRRFDNETTGISFQVSESPPVKSRKSVDDLAREREIDLLSRQAVTKSRLEAIRESEDRELQQRASQSPNGSSLKRSTSRELPKPEAAEVGESIPDTPIVVFRSSSSSSRETTRPNHDRQTSHDALQRFARLSATPKSSPPISTKTLETKEEPPKQAGHDAKETEEVHIRQPLVAATPKVTGGWTDTILPPDTAATVKASKALPRYAQTPHVSAGGWVDTPIPAAARPDTIDEVTEDITAEAPVIAPSNPPQQPEIGHSALHNILASQRAHNPTDTADTTLNLGETTIASLEDLVDLTDQDVSTLIRMGAEHDALISLQNSPNPFPRAAQPDIGLPPGTANPEEIQVLDRLARKLHTLQANIRHARKAANRFEREMSEGTGGDGVTDAENDDTEAIANTAQIVNNKGKNVRQATKPTTWPASLLPVSYQPIRFPLPVLFHPTTTSPAKVGARHLRGARLGRPTPLFWILVTMLVWYITETAVVELCTHPLYAETYSWPSSVGTGVGAAEWDVGPGGYLFSKVLGGMLGEEKREGAVRNGANVQVTVAADAEKTGVAGEAGWFDGVLDWFAEGWNGAAAAVGESEEGVLADMRHGAESLREAVASAVPGDGAGWSMDDDEVV